MGTAPPKPSVRTGNDLVQIENAHRMTRSVTEIGRTANHRRGNAIENTMIGNMAPKGTGVLDPKSTGVLVVPGRREMAKIGPLPELTGMVSTRPVRAMVLRRHRHTTVTDRPSMV